MSPRPTSVTVGERFGRLVVISQSPDRVRNECVWNCVCDCGRIATATTGNLRRGSTRSCGCLRRDAQKGKLSKKAATVQIGERYGRLVVAAEHSERLNQQRAWLCDCDCGGSAVVPSGKLRTGHTRSCGCLQREHRKQAGEQTKTHNQRDHPLYMIWSSMRQRCSNANLPEYPYYGGRGIVVCERWQRPNGFPNFLADVGERPPDPPGWNGKRPYYSIDRIDNDGNYEPANVRWATHSEQMLNRRQPPT